MLPRVNPHEQPDVKVDGEGEERDDVAAVAGGGGRDGVEDEPEGELVRELGPDGDAAVVGEAVRDDRGCQRPASTVL